MPSLHDPAKAGGVRPNRSGLGRRFVRPGCCAARSAFRFGLGGAKRYWIAFEKTLGAGLESDRYDWATVRCTGKRGGGAHFEGVTARWHLETDRSLIIALPRLAKNV